MIVFLMIAWGAVLSFLATVGLSGLMLTEPSIYQQEAYIALLVALLALVGVLLTCLGVMVSGRDVSPDYE